MAPENETAASEEYVGEEPGWYQDPENAGGRRYWDGEKWGQRWGEKEERVRPEGKANRLAVTALICATCVPFLFIAGALGVTFGFVALDEIEEAEGKERGAGMAQWAIGLGFLNLALSAAITGLIVWRVVG